MSYVRKGSGLCPEQADPTLSGDLLNLCLHLPSGQKLNVLNVYNAPGSNSESSLHILLNLPPDHFKGNCLLQGDFNLHHTRWQPSWPRSPSTGAESFIEWLDRNDLNLISPLDKATHNHGNLLDLAFAKGPILAYAKYRIARHLESTSDHLPLLTTFTSVRRINAIKRLRPDTLDSD